MDYVEHSELNGKHAFLSPSSYSWINYDEEKLIERFHTYRAKEKGTRLHAFAAEAIELGIKLPRSKKTLNMYVNDAIGYGMIPEFVLFYSTYCFGTADAMIFKNNKLRIHDLKSGVTPASIHQLEVYAAIFCLQYEKDPNDIEIELRIYQLDEAIVNITDPETIQMLMNKIVKFDMVLDSLA